MSVVRTRLSEDTERLIVLGEKIYATRLELARLEKSFDDLVTKLKTDTEQPHVQLYIFKQPNGAKRLVRATTQEDARRICTHGRKDSPWASAGCLQVESRGDAEVLWDFPAPPSDDAITDAKGSPE